MPEFTVHGVKLSLPSDLAKPGLVGKLENGTYEYDEGNAARRCIRPGFRVLELGAGMGFVTAICAMRAGAENVLSVEANPRMLDVIRVNLALNGQEGVTLMHGAVTGHAEPGQTARLRLGDALTSSRLARKNVRADTIEVPLVPIADLIRMQRPHVVIMDVEGAEAHLFAQPWKCPLRFLVLELHPKQYAQRVIKKIVEWASDMHMTYDPSTSRGKTLGFRRVWHEEEGPAP